MSGFSLSSHASSEGRRERTPLMLKVATLIVGIGACLAGTRSGDARRRSGKPTCTARRGPIQENHGAAGNGEEAIAQDEAHHPDVVLLDLVMPQLDGKGALQGILQHDGGARVVILSSLGAQGDIEECLRLGAASYLQKPIDPDAMVRVLRQAIG